MSREEPEGEQGFGDARTSADGRILQSLYDLSDDTAEELADRYVGGFDDVLRSFVRRHEDSIRPALTPKLLEYTRALDASGLGYVGFVQTDQNNFLCVFSTADLHATERTHM